MGQDLLPVWKEIEWYLDNGISVIPVRDRDDANGVAKSPYGKWTIYQKQRIDKDELFELLDVRYNTTAIAIIGGKVSGNLEIIDIDVKYKNGIDAILLTDLKTLYPDLFARLRIHKTPSGGYHILYRCETLVNGNQKLAGREATDSELLLNQKQKSYHFIETRGEGGYIVAPPALGYSVITNVNIPVITSIERESLLALCRSYSDLIEVKSTYTRPTKRNDDYYETNPFEDFNNRCDPGAIMQDLGWAEYNHNNYFIWYTRPGKSKGVSISFNLQKRFFYCFTASSELEASKGYSPSNLIAALKFNNDKKALYQYLTSQGYGKIKTKIEKQIAKKAATNNKQLPANISEDAKSEFEQIKATLTELHPYGVFWIDSVKNGIQIDRELLYKVAHGLGFRLYNEKPVYTDGTYIDKVEDRFFFDSIKAYIKEDDADLNKDICNAFEVFIERHGKFTISRLQPIPAEDILHDTIDTSYKPYQNGVLQITANDIKILPSIDKLIWRDRVQPRNYSAGASGKYVDFLKKATDWEANKGYILTCIGYLAHDFKDETAGYIIVLTEQCENPKDGGGAGKNVFSELFKYTTSYTGKPGSQVKYDEKFMQSWNGQKIFCISDVPKHFKFEFLKELSTGTALMKKLYSDEKEIPVERMPKFIIQTNYSYEISDGGIRRRIKPIEFTDFFTRSGGIDVHYGVHFPKGWTDEDWAGYDNTIATAIQIWLQNGRKIGEAELSESGWIKQFEQTHKDVCSRLVRENFEGWLSKGWISNDEFKVFVEGWYRENNIHANYQPSVTKINAAIADWAGKFGKQFRADVVKKRNGIVSKYRFFGDENDAPF